MLGLKEKLDKLLAGLLVVLFSVLLLSVLWQVASRYLLGSPATFTEEVARFSFIWLALLGSAYVAGRREHLAIDLLPTALQGTQKRVLEFVIQGLSLLFGLCLLGGGAVLVRTSFELGQRSPVLGLPLGAVYSVVPLFGLLLSFYLLCPAAPSRGASSTENAVS